MMPDILHVAAVIGERIFRDGQWNDQVNKGPLFVFKSDII